MYFFQNKYVQHLFFENTKHFSKCLSAKFFSAHLTNNIFKM
jgi:hypothetical protein